MSSKEEENNKSFKEGVNDGRNDGDFSTNAMLKGFYGNSYNGGWKVGRELRERDRSENRSSSRNSSSHSSTDEVRQDREVDLSERERRDNCSSSSNDSSVSAVELAFSSVFLLIIPTIYLTVAFVLMQNHRTLFLNRTFLEMLGILALVPGIIFWAIVQALLMVVGIILIGRPIFLFP